MVTVPSENTYAVFSVTSSSTGPFAFDFPYFAKTDLEVWVDDTQLGQSDFTLSNGSGNATAGYDGGSVTLVTGVANSEVYVIRNVVAERSSNLSSGGVTGTAINAALNKLTMHAQDRQRDDNRSLRVVAGEDGYTLPVAADRASKLFGFDSNGDVLMTAVGDVSAVAAIVDKIDTITETGTLTTLNAIYADLDGDDTIGDAAALLAVSSPGIVCKATDGTPTSRTLEVGTGLSINEADGGDDNPSISLHAHLVAIAGMDATDGNILVGNGTTFVEESGATARTSLGLAIGTDVQAYDADLAAIAALAKNDGNIIVGNGSAWVAESGATARTSLGLAIGSDVQAYDADLTAIAALSKNDGNIIVGNGSAWVAESGATARTSLGLAIGTDVLAYDANLQAFVTAFTLPESDGSADQVLKTNGSGTLSFVDQSSGSGDDFGANFEVVEPGVSASATHTAIEAALTSVGANGTVMLAPGQTFQIDDDIAMSTDGQTLIIPAGTTLQSDGSTRRAVRMTGDDCTVMGNGLLDKAYIVIGVSGTKGSGLGARVLGQLSIKDSTSRAVNVSDAYSDDKPIIIEGVRVYWSSGGIAAAQAGVPLCINCDTIDTTENGRNLVIRNCVVDFREWSLEQVAEIMYPTAGTPNPIGIRVRANNESTFRDVEVQSNQVWYPAPTSKDAWDPTNYGNSADTYGRRRPTCYEMTAVRSTITYSSKSGSFTNGETITGGTSGSTRVVGTDSTTTMTVYGGSGSFIPGETITGGTSSETATYESRTGHAQNFEVTQNLAYGGDLQFSFGKMDYIHFSNNRAVGDCTSYCLECAHGETISGSGNAFISALAGKALSCTNTRNVSLPGSFIRAGINSNFSANSGVAFEGVNQINLSGSQIEAGADSVQLVRIVTSVEDSVLNLTGVTLVGTGFSSVKGVRFDSGSAHTINMTGVNAFDVGGNVIEIDSGVTLDRLITIGCAGYNSGGYSNSGTVSSHLDGYNGGISGLTGTPASGSGDLVAANNLSDLDNAGTARTNLGLGALATADDINDSDWSGTDLAVANGGTGASTASAARTNLGLGSTDSPTFAGGTVTGSGDTTWKIETTYAASTTFGLYLKGGTSSRIAFQNAAGATQGHISTNVSTNTMGFNIGGGSNEIELAAGEVTIPAATVNMANLPTSSGGLATGDLWNDSGTLKIA